MVCDRLFFSFCRRRRVCLRGVYTLDGSITRVRPYRYFLRKKKKIVRQFTNDDIIMI